MCLVRRHLMTKEMQTELEALVAYWALAGCPRTEANLVARKAFVVVVGLVRVTDWTH